MNKLDKIVRPTEFKAEDIVFTAPRKVNDRTQVYLNYTGARRWGWETPYLKAPFGPSSYQKGDTGIQDYSLPLQAVARNPEEQEQVDKFFSEFEKMDQRVLEFAQKHSKMLLGKQYTDQQLDIVEVMTGKCVRKNDKYPDRISPKIPKKRDSSGKPDIVAFHKTPEPIQPNSFDEIIKHVPRNTFVKCIIRPRFWVVGGKCGVSLFMQQIVYPEDSGIDVSSTSGFDASTFKSVDTQNAEADESAKADESDEVEDSDDADTNEVDEDEDEDDDDDDEEEEVSEEA